MVFKIFYNVFVWALSAVVLKKNGIRPIFAKGQTNISKLQALNHISLKEARKKFEKTHQRNYRQYMVNFTDIKKSLFVSWHRPFKLHAGGLNENSYNNQANQVLIEN